MLSTFKVKSHATTIFKAYPSWQVATILRANKQKIKKKQKSLSYKCVHMENSNDISK